MSDGPTTPESVAGKSSQQLQATSSSEGKNPPSMEATVSTKPPTPQETSEEQNPQSPPSKESTNSSETELKLTNQALIAFLEKQKYQVEEGEVKEGEGLTADQQEFNKNVDKFLEQLTQDSNQPISLENLINTLNFGYQRARPAILEGLKQIESLINETQEQLNDPKTPEEQRKELDQKIYLLNEMKKEREELLKNELELPKKIIEHAETVFGELSDKPELKQRLIAGLNNGNFDQVMEVFVDKGLEDNENDHQNIKEEKAKARNIVESFKKNAPIVGGVAAILLLLMILKASKSTGGGQGGMMG